MLVEVIFRPSFKAIDSMAKEDLVTIHGKDLLLGEVAFDLQRQDHLLYLAAEMTFRRKKQIARKLHGQRGSALRARSRRYIAVGGSQHAPEVDAPVLLKTLVFRGQDGIAQDFGEIIVGSQNAALQRERPDDPAMVVI